MGHKSTGDWGDVTSLARNEIVFEGRNKEYGAYYVRQNYDRALLMGLLFSLSLLVLGGGVPYLISKLSSHPIIPATKEDGKEAYHIIKDYVFPPPPKPNTNITPPPRPLDKQPADRNTPPEVVRTVPITDSAPHTQHDLQTHAVGATEIPGDRTTEAPTPPTNPGTEGVETSTEVFKVVQVMPKFQGDLSDFLSKNIEYTQQIRDIGIQGTVYVQFIIEADGSVSHITILKGITGADELSKSAIAGIEKMPKWQPGYQNGHPVRVQYMIPVKFQLN